MARWIRFSSAFMLAVLVLLAMVLPVSAEVYTLNPGDSIQAAVETAADGDTIVLNPGIYPGTTMMMEEPKDITITANTAAGGNRENTIIEGTATDGIIRDFTRSVTIHGLTFRNSGNDWVDGGAIWAEKVTVTDSAFINCNAYQGGAIFSREVYVTNTVFTDCSAHHGGAINALYLMVHNSAFINCSADSGGALFGSGDVSSTSFINCSADPYHVLSLPDYVSVHPLVDSGGAIYAVGPLTVYSSTFNGCIAGNNGGALFTEDTVSVTRSTFTNCLPESSAARLSGDVGAVTLASSAGILSNVAAVPNPSPDDMPADVELPIGLIDLSISDVSTGGASTVTIHLPDGTAADTYWKYGKTPADPVPHWYEFLYDGQTGAEFIGNDINLHFIDGLRGDDDITANGIISDPGAPGLKVAHDNVAPAVTLSPDNVVINTGEGFTGAGAFTDPDADAWSATVDYGDGTGIQPLVLNADKSFSISHNFKNPGSYIITIVVQDGKSSGTATAVVTVKPVVAVSEFPSAFLPVTFIGILLGVALALKRTHE